MRHRITSTFHLRNFLLVFFLLLLLVLFSLLFLLPFRLYTSLYMEQAEYYCDNFLAQANIGVSSALEDFEKKIHQIQEDPVIQELLTSTVAQKDSQYNYQITIAKYFQPQTMDEYYLQELDLYAAQSGEALVYGTKPTQLTAPFESIYYQQALSYPTSLNWVGYNSQEACIDISLLLYDSISYQVQGIFIIRLSPDFLLDKFNSYSTLEIDSLYIADGNRQILGTTEPEALGSSLSTLSLSSSDHSQSVQLDDGLAVIRPLKESNASFPYNTWSSVIVLDRQSLLADFHKIARFFYPLALIILAAAVFCILKFSNFVTAPISALLFAMKKAEKGKLDIQLEENYPLKEIAEINTGFNKMSQRLDNLINSNYKIRLAEQEAKIKSLQAQINPHFLFNTLQLISWKAYEYEAYPVCDMLGNLSYMLQTDLRSDDESTFTLREEIEYIRQYSSIIRAKYADKIQILLEVPEDLMDCRIPKLILQPILENSISHGLAPKTSPGHVTLAVRREERDLVAVIQDTGIGMRSNVLQSLSQETRKDIPSSESNGHHIALNNIQSRIHLLYGPNYGFTIESQLNIGTTVTLRIPYEKIYPSSQ